MTVDDKLTRKSQEALSQAVQRATTAGNPNVDGLHLLAALIEQEGGIAAPLLRAVGADPAAVLATVNERLARLPKAAGAESARPPWWKGWRSASWPATCPSRCAASASCRSTWARWSRARSTAASSRSG